MTRELRTPDQLRQAAADAEDAASKLRAVAEQVENEGMEGILFHGNSVINKSLPNFWHWANLLAAEFDAQAKAFRAGVESKAAYDKRRNQPNYPIPPKKATKKKRR